MSDSTGERVSTGKRDERWANALEVIKHRVSKESFHTWIEAVHFVSLQDGELTLKLPNAFYVDWVRTHYESLILEALTSVQTDSDLAAPTSVRWEVDERVARPVEPPARPRPSARAESAPAAPRPRLSPKYLFDSFVVGPSNQLAHAASLAAASDPGVKYNPLFIYGGVGLGKTHLVNAIGHRIRLAKPGARIHYLSAEDFTNQFIWALKNKNIEDFRARYRESCDVLLMDDIQFLANREQTQEEFFHTFNALHLLDKQIVVTSDVDPSHLKGMEERLVSRFQSGMIADVQCPALDTRVAILQKKADQEEILLTGEVADYIAQAVKSNVRELEGTLLRLAVKAELLHRPIDIALTRETLSLTSIEPDQAHTVEDIQRAVAGYFDLRLADLKSKRRTRTLTIPRMIAMYLCRSLLNVPLTHIGARFDKDHTTVMHACKRITSMVESDARVRGQVEAIERKLGY